MPSTLRFDAVLFDFDGTLADTQADVWVSLRHAAGRVGARLPERVTANPVNLALPVERLFELLEPAVPGDRLALFERECARHYRHANPMEHTRLYPGVEPLLDVLRAAGVPCCIATLKPAEALGRLLARKGWDRWFSRCISPDSLGGEPLTKAAMIGVLLRLLAAGRPVYVGDSAPDILAANGNGIPAVAVTYGDGDTAALLGAGPAHVAHSAAGLADILLGDGAPGDPQ